MSEYASSNENKNEHVKETRKGNQISHHNSLEEDASLQSPDDWPNGQLVIDSTKSNKQEEKQEFKEKTLN